MQIRILQGVVVGIKNAIARLLTGGWVRFKVTSLATSLAGLLVVLVEACNNKCNLWGEAPEALVSARHPLHLVEAGVSRDRAAQLRKLSMARPLLLQRRSPPLQMVLQGAHSLKQKMTAAATFGSFSSIPTLPAPLQEGCVTKFIFGRRI